MRFSNIYHLFPEIIRMWCGYGFIVILLLFLFSACDLLIEEKPPSIDDPRVIRAAILRGEDFKTRRLEMCISGYINDAEIHVDTTLAQLIDRYLADDYAFPERPERPLRPGQVILDSGFVAAPIFDSIVFPKKKADTSWFPEDFPGSGVPDSILRRYVDTMLVRKQDTTKVRLPDTLKNLNQDGGR